MKWSPEEVAEKILHLTQDKLAANVFLVSSLAHFQPFSLWTESISNGLYISLRHIIL